MLDDRMQASRSAFCAEASARGRAWLSREVTASEDLSWKCVHPSAIRVATSRGVTDLERFFVPSLVNNMPDPYVLADMERAVEAVRKAVISGATIGIVGDYDVDGATSTSILVRFLAMLGHANVAWRIPHRERDGYGPNDRIVDEMVGKGVEVLMIVDSGTAAVETVAYARSRGLEVVILDHHEAHETLPDAILVNPKRPDAPSDLSYLCTAGIAFLFAVALRRRLAGDGRTVTGDLRSLLGLVALGTVCDVVPLVGLNRAYVATGLSHMASIPGVRALMDVTERNDATPTTCGFVFGPCLNAAGRLQDMSTSVDLLTTDDPVVARKIATSLHELNQERRSLQKAAVDAARERVESLPSIPSAIVLYDESWVAGIVGLVAARIKDAFDRPTIVVGAGGKGSCRSVDGFHIGHAVIEASERKLLAKGGGHAMAAGLTLDAARLEEFTRYMLDATRDLTPTPTGVDLVVPCGELRLDVAEGLSRLEPFGAGNPEPRVALTGGRVAKVRVLKEAHVKVEVVSDLGRSEAICFGCVGTPLGDALVASEGRRIDLYGRPVIDVYAGVRRVTLRVEDAMVEA